MATFHFAEFQLAEFQLSSGLPVGSGLGSGIGIWIEIGELKGTKIIVILLTLE